MGTYPDLADSSRGPVVPCCSQIWSPSHLLEVAGSSLAPSSRPQVALSQSVMRDGEEQGGEERDMLGDLSGIAAMGSWRTSGDTEVLSGVA